jgi:protein-S-isoprenylcysteine O-methyltransferase Ste14
MDLGKAVRDRWVWAQIGLFIVVGFAAPLLPRHIDLGPIDYMLNRLDPVRVRWWGGLLIAAGGVMLGWGARSLGSNLTPGTEPLAQSRLITAGAYAHTRHPIYAGVVLLLAGYTLLWSNWTLALLAGAGAMQFFKAKARKEETYLAERFPEYDYYRQQVPRLLF